MPKNIGGMIVLAVLYCCAVTGQARAQQQPPEDPEDDKKSDTPRGAGGLVSGAASKAVVPLVEASR